jgi:translation initiation factor 2 beta subunit (eIF-2beta)/eIF-5
MDSKLTLKLSAEVIESAKKFAKENNRSLSALVEDYFKELTQSGKQERKYSPLVRELSGVISVKEVDKLSYTDYLEKKYE